jgi:hypothetical protein
MADLLKATDTSSRAGLVKALERAAAAGRTSTAETILGAIFDRYPDGATDEAVRALNRAVHGRQWATASYLADFLADTAPPRGGARGGGGSLASEHIDQEVLRCLADHRREHRETAPPGEPFLLTDAIEEKCLERGVGFALTVAIVDCMARGVAHADRLECARRRVASVGGGGPIAFEHVDPGLPPDAYGGGDNPCMHFSLAAPERSAATLRGKDDVVAPPGALALRVTFPPGVSGTYEVETTGSRESLARAVAAKYGELLATGASGYDLADLDLERVVPGVDSRQRAVYTVEVAA